MMDNAKSTLEDLPTDLVGCFIEFLTGAEAVALVITSSALTWKAAQTVAPWEDSGFLQFVWNVSNDDEFALLLERNAFLADTEAITGERWPFAVQARMIGEMQALLRLAELTHATTIVLQPCHTQIVMSIVQQHSKSFSASAIHPALFAPGAAALGLRNVSVEVFPHLTSVSSKSDLVLSTPNLNAIAAAFPKLKSLTVMRWAMPTDGGDDPLFRFENLVMLSIRNHFSGRGFTPSFTKLTSFMPALEVITVTHEGVTDESLPLFLSLPKLLVLRVEVYASTDVCRRSNIGAHFEWLDLRFCTGLTVKGIASIVSQQGHALRRIVVAPSIVCDVLVDAALAAPRLETLEAQGAHSDASTVLRRSATDQQLHSIDLTQVAVNATCLNRIAASGCDALQSLNVSKSNVIVPESIILNLVHNSPNLRELVLGASDVTWSVMDCALSCKALRRLATSEVILDRENERQDFRSVNFAGLHHAPEELLLATCERLPQLDSVSLRRRPRMNDEFLSLMSAKLPRCTWLDLTGCVGMSDAGLASALSALPLMRTLHLADMPPIGPLTQSVVGVMQHLQALVVDALHLEGSLVALLVTSPQFLELKASIGVRSFVVVSRQMASDQFQFLSTKKCRNFGDGGVLQVAAKLPGLIDAQLLYCSSITAAGVLRLIELRPLLQVLAVDAATVTDESIGCILRLPHLVKFTVVPLGRDPIDVLKRRSPGEVITQINLQHCKSLSTRGFHVVLNLLPQLQKIDVTGCDSIDQGAVYEARLSRIVSLSIDF